MCSNIQINGGFENIKENYYSKLSVKHCITIIKKLIEIYQLRQNAEEILQKIHCRNRFIQEQINTVNIKINLLVKNISLNQMFLLIIDLNKII